MINITFTKALSYTAYLAIILVESVKLNMVRQIVEESGVPSLTGASVLQVDLVNPCLFNPYTSQSEHTF